MEQFTPEEVVMIKKIVATKAQEEKEQAIADIKAKDVADYETERKAIIDAKDVELEKLQVAWGDKLK